MTAPPSAAGNVSDSSSAGSRGARLPLSGGDVLTIR